MPAGSLLNRPAVLSVYLQTVENALLPPALSQTTDVSHINDLRKGGLAASVTSLSPVKLSAPDRLTSELLRFL